jgi:ankyrin repeat protein
MPESSPILSLPIELHYIILSNINEARNLYSLLCSCRHFSIVVAPYLWTLAVHDKAAYPFRWAAHVNNVSLMRRLVCAGVDIFATETEDIPTSKLKYKTALDIVLEEGHINALKVLLDYSSCTMELQTETGLLDLPASRGDIPMLQLLLEYIPCDQRNKYDRFNWNCAVSMAVWADQFETVVFLMDQGLDFSNQLDTAASLGHMETVRLLLERASFGDEKARNEKINSALFEAVRAGKVDVMVLLVDRGADVTYVSEEGMTAVHCAAEKGLCSALDVLIKNGADVNVRSAEGITPLHLAAKHDQFSALELLINNGAYINATDDEGRTALHYVARAPLARVSEPFRSPKDIAWTVGTDIAWLLVQNGATIDGKDSSNWTPMDVAVHRGRIGLARTLLMARERENFPSDLWELHEVLERMDPDYEGHDTDWF